MAKALGESFFGGPKKRRDRDDPDAADVGKVEAKSADDGGKTTRKKAPKPPSNELAKIEARLREDLERGGGMMVAYTPLRTTGMTMAANADTAVRGVMVLAENHAFIYKALRGTSDVEGILLLGSFAASLAIAMQADLSGREPTGFAAESLGVRAAWDEVIQAYGGQGGDDETSAGAGEGGGNPAASVERIALAPV